VGPREVVPVERLQPELCSMVMAATADAAARVIECRHGEHGDEYEVHAIAGDRFVHMLLTVRPDDSVEETIHSEPLERVQVVATGTERATLRLPDDIVAIPLEIVAALAKPEV